MSIPLQVTRGVVHLVPRFRNNHCRRIDVDGPISSEGESEKWVNLESLLICLDPSWVKVTTLQGLLHWGCTVHHADTHKDPPLIPETRALPSLLSARPANRLAGCGTPTFSLDEHSLACWFVLFFWDTRWKRRSCVLCWKLGIQAWAEGG